MKQLQDYRAVTYRQQDGAWVAEVAAISGCCALMPTRQEAIVELAYVFEMIREEYTEKGNTLPADSTEVPHA